MDSKILINCGLEKTTFMKKWELDYSEELFLLIQKDKKHLGEFLDFIERTNEIKDTRCFIEGSISDFANGKKYEYGIFTEVSGGNLKLIGAVGIVNITEKDEEKTAEIGYWLSSDMQGKGVMINGVKILLQVAHARLKIRRFILKIIGDNTKSTSLAKKIGFVEVGSCQPQIVIRGVSFIPTEYELKLC